MFEEGIKHRRVEAGEFKYNTKEWKKEGDVTISSDIDIDELDCGKDRYAISILFISLLYFGYCCVYGPNSFCVV